MIKRILIFLVSAGLPVSAQDAINFEPKLLTREMNALGLQSNSLEELPVTPDFTGQPYKGKYFTIAGKDDQYYVYVGRVNSCRAGGCTPDNTDHNESISEYFDYFILFDKNGIVEKIRVYNYRATHGAEITAQGWLNQFKGYDGKTGISAGKQVDAISGATISVNGITYDVQQKTRLLRSLLEKPGPDGKVSP